LCARHFAGLWGRNSEQKIWALLPEDLYLGMEMNNKIPKQKERNFTLILVLCRGRARKEERELWRGKSLALLVMKRCLS